LNIIKRAATALVATLALGGGALALTATPAAAHSFGAQGPPHNHTSCTLAGSGGSTCYRWILENGAIRQGSFNSLQGEWSLVGVVCSFSSNTGPPYPGAYGEGWIVNNVVSGEWGSNGYHTYCQNPKYPTPVSQGGWSVNY
jgi:hypothetical protein